MTLADICCECEGQIDVTKRVYRGPYGLPRCPVCQVLAECRLEIARISAIVEMMEDVGEMHLDVVRTTGGRTH